MTLILQHYLTEYEKTIKSTAMRSNPQRKAALEYFLTKGFPHVKDENWRYTARSFLLQQPFTLATPSAAEHTNILLPAAFNQEAVRLVFVNGYFTPHLSSSSERYPQGLLIKNFREADAQSLETTFPQWIDHSTEFENAFTALNTAFFQDGALIQVENNCTITAPIELWFIQTPTSTPSLIPVRNIFQVGENSHVRFIERYWTPQTDALSKGSANYLTNTVSELELAPQAHVTWSQVITVRDNDCHIGQLQVTQQHDSHFQSESIVLGGGLVRHTLPVYLQGERATCVLNGLSLAKNRHHIDHALAIHHQASHTQSDVHYRAIADHQSRVAFSGGVNVIKGISKIQANQHNHNLLLSAHAEIDTQPKLELFADDIMCTHGATVGEIDETALFYLRARGIGESEARLILMDAFNQIILQKMTLANDAQLQTQLTTFTRPTNKAYID
jgi:Fe-S cluster assembly protein SufD